MLFLLIILPLLIFLLTSFKWSSGRIVKVVSIAFFLSFLLLLMVNEEMPFCETIGGYNKILGIEFCVNKTKVSLLLSIFCVFSHFILLNRRLPFAIFPMLSALIGIILTNDIFNMFVWFEVLIISSIVLSFSGQTDIKAVFKYSIFNFLSGFCFLVGIALIYKHYGVLNLDALSEISKITETNSGIVFLFVAMAIKAGIIPYHVWLGASYHKFDATYVPLFVSVLTKIGVYGFFKINQTIGGSNEVFLPVILTLSSVSIVVCSFLSYGEQNVARSLAFFSGAKSGFLFIMVFFVEELLFNYFMAFDILLSYFFTHSFLVQKSKNLALFLGFSWMGFPLTGLFLINIWILIDALDYGNIFLVLFILYKLSVMVICMRLLDKASDFKSGSILNTSLIVTSIVILTVVSIRDFLLHV